MNAPETFDAVVVGAGPAGCTLSRLLALKGKRVLVVEKESPGQRHVCGGFLGPEAVPVFEDLGLTQSLDGLPKNIIHRVRVSGPNTGPMDCGFPRGSGWAIEREVFGDWLARRAVEAGVELADSCRVVSQDRAADSWELILEKHGSRRLVHSRFLVFSNGRRPPAHLNSQRAFFACKTVYRGVQAPADRVALHFVDKGHVGLNPLGDGTSTMCLHVENSYLRAAKGDLDGMMRRLLAANAALADEMRSAVRVSEWHVCVAEPDRRKRFFEEGAFFAGDAVTMVDPIVGGGIPIAMAGAAMLAKLMIRAIEMKNRQDLWIAEHYKKAWEARFGSRARLAASLGRAERSVLMSRLCFSLMGIAPMVLRGIVSGTRRDEPVSLAV